MERFSIKTKLIILIILICGVILLISNDTYACCQNFNITHYQRNLFINKQNEKGLRDGVIKLPLVNKSGSNVEWRTSNSKVAIVNQYRICNRDKFWYCYNYC